MYITGCGPLHTMADSAASGVVAFTRDDFPRYLKLLHAQCSKGIGSIAMSGDDPITSHLRDDFIKEMVSAMYGQAVEEGLRKIHSDRL